MTPPELTGDQRLYHTLGKLETKLDHLSEKLTDDRERTSARLDGVAAKQGALEARVDKVESDIDKARGAGIAARVAWMLGGGVAGGVVLQIVLAALGGG